MTSKATGRKGLCHNSWYVKCLITAKQRMYYTATYFDRMYRCGKEEELLRWVTTKMYPQVGNGQSI